MTGLNTWINLDNALRWASLKYWKNKNDKTMVDTSIIIIVIYKNVEALNSLVSKNIQIKICENISDTNKKYGENTNCPWINFHPYVSIV